MEASKFRAAQEPLKERYRKDAKAALLTLKAKGRADDSTVTCKVETGHGLAVAGIHPKCGGLGLELCSGDLLLEALIACAGVSLKAAASVLDVPVKSATISAEGDVDLRGPSASRTMCPSDSRRSACISMSRRMPRKATWLNCLK